MKMRKEFLFLTATHGNEQFSIPIMRRLEKETMADIFDWSIANPKAFKHKNRFIDADLNRVAPGKKNSLIYEEKRAFELVQEFKKYRYVIDIHGTSANTGIFTIITNPRPENLLLATALPIANVVIWAPEDLNQQGPLTQFAPCGLEIECGPKDSAVIRSKLARILREIAAKGIGYDKGRVREKRFFRVYGSVSKISSGIRKRIKLQEFTKMSYGDEKFYPLFIDRYKGKMCYKMEKINF